MNSFTKKNKEKTVKGIKEGESILMREKKSKAVENISKIYFEMEIIVQNFWYLYRVWQ